MQKTGDRPLSRSKVVLFVVALARAAGWVAAERAKTESRGSSVGLAWWVLVGSMSGILFHDELILLAGVGVRVQTILARQVAD